MKSLLAALVGAVVLLATAAVAQEPAGRRPVPEALELTMTLLPENARRPDTLRNVIELPRDGDGAYRPSERAVERSARGLATANLARELGRDFGQVIAEAAQQRREDATRGARAASEAAPPTDRPDLPQRPDTPASPGGP
ncbi:MAG TPA: hypothetical protein VIN61_14990 [Gammaproteobacteria bacterium]